MTQLVAITVHTQQATGEPIVSFEVYGEVVAPGLAITPAVYGTAYHGAWSLTHVPSGRALCQALCLPCCRRLAEVAVKGGADWTKSMDEVVLDVAAIAAYRAGRAAEDACSQGWTCGGAIR